MFRHSKRLKYQDRQLGELRLSGGYWEGECLLSPRGMFKLKLSGGRKSPDIASLALARELPERFTDLLNPMEESLFEHYQPYRDAAVAGSLPEGSRVSMRSAARLPSGGTPNLSRSSSSRYKAFLQSKSLLGSRGTKNTPSLLASRHGGSWNCVAAFS